MKFEQLIPLMLNKTPEESLHDFELYVHQRNQDINTYNEETKRKLSKSKQERLILTDEEKILMKALGLKQKDLLSLRGITSKSSKQIMEEENNAEEEDDDESVVALIND